MVVHFASAPHEEALGDILAAVAAAAGKRQLFKQMDVFAFHLSVANEIERSGQTGETGADDVSGFLIYIFWFFGMSERFIRSCRVIHNNNLPFFLCAFSIPILMPFTIDKKSSVIKNLSRSGEV